MIYRMPEDMSGQLKRVLEQVIEHKVAEIKLKLLAKFREEFEAALVVAVDECIQGLKTYVDRQPYQKGYALEVNFCIEEKA